MYLMNHCDIYPSLPCAYDLAKLQAYLPPILKLEAVSALRLCFDAPLSQKYLQKICALVQEHDVALILSPAKLELIRDVPLSKIDGVHLPSLAEVKSFAGQKDRPKHLQVGCSCQTLDEAMSAGERGADYIGLPATELLSLTQWSLIAELPSVAEGIHNLEQARASAEAGTDFLGIPLSLEAGTPSLITEVHSLISEG